MSCSSVVRLFCEFISSKLVRIPGAEWPSGNWKLEDGGGFLVMGLKKEWWGWLNQDDRGIQAADALSLLIQSSDPDS